MPELINADQAANLTRIILSKKLELEWILIICKASKISDITIKQYNFLLLILNN